MKENKKQPHLQLSEVQKFCLLSGNPDRVPTIANSLKSGEKIADYRGLVAFNGRTARYDIPVSVLTTGMGCPSTAIILEEAFRAGGRVFIRIGSCGALENGMKIGGVVIPHAAIRDERTSLNFAPMEFPASASPDIYHRLCVSADKLKIDYYSGIVWTTDIYYSSNQEEYKKWAKCGANSVEMESALIFTFGSVKKVKTGSILVIDGNLAEGTQKSDQSLGESKSHFKIGIQEAILCAIEAIETFSGILN